MYELTKLHDARLPVVLKSTTNDPVNSVSYLTVNLTVLKANGTSSDISIGVGDWFQITSGAYSAQGYYNLLLTGTYLDVTGVFQYCVNVTGAVPYFGVMKVVEGDTTAIYNRIGQPVSGSISNDIQNIPTSVSSGGFGASDRAMLSATWHTASWLPSDPASNSHLDAQLSLSFWTSDRSNLQAIKNKTDNLPSDPLGVTVLNGGLTATYTTINTNTNNGFTTIKGGSWGSDQTLYNIGVHTSATWNAGATQAYLSYTFGKITGTGFTEGADDLHGLSAQIQGITPGSGGGGFSTDDRAMLSAAYSASMMLPGDPASNSYISGIIVDTRGRIMGTGSYGAGTGTTIYQIAQDTNTIKTKTQYIPNATMPTSGNLADTMNYIIGTGYVAVSDSLHAIASGVRDMTFSSSFTAQDRTWVSSTYVSQSIIKGAIDSDYNTLYNTSLLIKAKTDNLPASPADQITINQQYNVLSSSLATSGGFSNQDRINIEYISQTLGRPQGATVSADVKNIIDTQSSQGVKINAIYTKTDALPVDPASQTYVSLVSGTLSTQMYNEFVILSSTMGNVSGTLSTQMYNEYIVLSSSIRNVSASISSTVIDAINASMNAAVTASNDAQIAAYNALAANTTAGGIVTLIGTPMSGTVSADLSSTYHLVTNISATFTGTISASVDLSPVLAQTKIIKDTLGKPVSTVSRDIYEVATMVKSSNNQKS